MITFSHAPRSGKTIRQSTSKYMKLIYTVLPRLVRMRTIKLMKFSGFVLTERACYLAVHFLTHYSDVFSKFFDKKNPLILSNFLRFLAFLSNETLI